MNWLYTLYFGYLWPSLKGNGPEALAQTIIYGLAAVALYPPLRKAAKREAEHLHAKLDHVIKHSKDIPVFDDAKHGFDPKDARKAK